jgi:hypothetical protein
MVKERRSRVIKKCIESGSTGVHLAVPLNHMFVVDKLVCVLGFLFHL